MSDAMIKAPVTVIVRAVRQSGRNFTLEETTQSGIDVTYQDDCKGCQVSASCELQNTFVGSVLYHCNSTNGNSKAEVDKTKNYYLPIGENYATDQASNRNINCIKNTGDRGTYVPQYIGAKT